MNGIKWINRGTGRFARYVAEIGYIKLWCRISCATNRFEHPYVRVALLFQKQSHMESSNM